MDDFERDPQWTSSLGEKIGLVHFRNGHWHAECNPKTGRCSIHYDKDDPHESITSLVKHMSASQLGLVILVTIGVGVLDQVLTGGQLRKTLIRSLSK